MKKQNIFRKFGLNGTALGTRTKFAGLGRLHPKLVTSISCPLCHMSPPPHIRDQSPKSVLAHVARVARDVCQISENMQTHYLQIRNSHYENYLI